MRKLHGSMMDAAGSRPGDMARAEWRLVKASLPDPEHPKRVPLPLLPVARAATLQSQLGQIAASQCARAFQAGAALPMLAFDPGAAKEAFALAWAVAQQWQSLHARWLEGVAELAEEAGEIRHANTVSKYVDQEVNLVQQALALVTAQASAAAQLLENIQVDFAWWLSQRTNPRG